MYQKAAEQLIPVTLELGGKSPNIIFADADPDVALDRSYRDKKLHPAVLTIMQKVGKPEASHLSRLRRLQQYQPEVFTALQQVLGREPMLLAWLDDLSRYEANPVLAVADD